MYLTLMVFSVALFQLENKLNHRVISQKQVTEKSIIAIYC